MIITKPPHGGQFHKLLTAFRWSSASGANCTNTNTATIINTNTYLYICVATHIQTVEGQSQAGQLEVVIKIIRIHWSSVIFLILIFYWSMVIIQFLLVIFWGRERGAQALRHADPPPAELFSISISPSLYISYIYVQMYIIFCANIAFDNWRQLIRVDTRPNPR